MPALRIFKFPCGNGSSPDGEFLCTEKSGVSFGCGFWKSSLEIYGTGSSSGAGIYGIAGLQSGVADRAWDPAGGGSHTCKYSEYSGTGCNQLSDHEILGNARKKKSEINLEEKNMSEKNKLTEKKEGGNL